MGFDAPVEVGIAAFCVGEEPPSDEEVWGRLTGAGVEPWLAERLLIFLPMAYTRGPPVRPVPGRTGGPRRAGSRSAFGDRRVTGLLRPRRHPRGPKPPARWWILTA
jgi:hypothetical protein